MQYHLNGFHTGDPAISSDPYKHGAKAGDVDVLIVGCGPAGLTLAAQLSAFPQITVRIVEQKSGPLKMGQADGIACRSIEMFEAFGFAEKVLKEAYWVNEVSFWRPDGAGMIHRADRILDVEENLSEMPHVILSQARVHEFFLEKMQNSPSRLKPDYNRALTALIRTDDPEYPVTATLSHEGETEIIRARYVVGCDGARSAVRRSMGIPLVGEAARQLWGVMDVLCVTDFPDIRLKVALQSAAEGSMLIIPREGGYLVRLYIELDALQEDERAADRKITADVLIEKARKILAPHTLDVKEVVWFSAYEIGQRVCDRFDDVPEEARGDQIPRIFIAGDACHTHSPKAGQGMNVSMADTFNLGWKLAAVVGGQATPKLLISYSEERRAKAKELIDFDRDMARLFSARPKDAVEAEQFQAHFKKFGRYTAGVETRYDPSLIIDDSGDQSLAKGYPLGMRFHSAPVVRLGDARKMELAHAVKADGRWRLFAFAGQDEAIFAQLCSFLDSDPQSPILRYTPDGSDIDSVIDLRAIFQTAHREMNVAVLPKLLIPKKGKHGLKDYEKVFCSDFNSADIFDKRGIDRKHGALIVVRPDQFVARVQPLTDTAGLSKFFARFMIG